MDDSKIGQYRHETLTAKRAYRRSRRSDIFRWSSTILVSIIGGSAALNERKLLTPTNAGLITLTILFAAGFSLFWVSHQRHIENKIESRIKHVEVHIFKAFEDQIKMTPMDRERVPVGWIQSLAIGLLAVVALCAVWQRDLLGYIASLARILASN